VEACEHRETPPWAAKEALRDIRVGWETETPPAVTLVAAKANDNYRREAASRVPQQYPDRDPIDRLVEAAFKPPGPQEAVDLPEGMESSQRRGDPDAERAWGGLINHIEGGHHRRRVSHDNEEGHRTKASQVRGVRHVSEASHS
jgi:hypothetical protein